MKRMDEVLKVLPKFFLLIMLVLVLIHSGFMVLLFGYGHDNVYGLADLFNMDEEGNIPTWFSSMILLSACFLLYINYTISSKIGTDRIWMLLSLVFLLLSIDEAAITHEFLIEPLRNRMNLENYFYYSWVIVGMLVVAIVGIISIPFLNKLPPRAAAYFIISGAIYVLGAIGMEMLGGNVAYISEQAGQGYEMLNYSIPYVMFFTIEETLEMTGVIFFNYTLIRHLEFVIQKKQFY